MAKTPIEPVSIWVCETCKTDGMKHPQMIEHLQQVHKLEVKGLKIHKKMVMHIDSADSFSSTYEVTIPTHPDIKLAHFTLNPRK